MRILLGGSSGLIGKELSRQLKEGGHDLYFLVRRASNDAKEIFWNPQASEINPALLENFDAVIHLGGENIAAKRWTEKFKQELRDSRILSTKLLSDTFNQLKNPPKTFLVASAIGYYGDRDDEALTEDSPPGKGFLSDLVKDWEAAAQRAKKSVARVVMMRFGVVISSEGGALKKMVTPFKMGLGGPLGNGKQFMSWVSLADVVKAIIFILGNSELQGAVNVVAPQAVTNNEFTRTLAAALHRPAFFRVPRFVVRLMVGQFADEALFASANVVPQKLSGSGFKFEFPELKGALKYELTKK